MLRRSGFSAEELEAIARDYHAAGLEPQEVAVMEFAEKLTLHAHAVTDADVQVLREQGLRDEEILDVILAASARNFWSKVMDATGTEADLRYLDLEPNVRKAMQKGRPFAQDQVCPLCFGTHILKKVRASDGREEYYCPACASGGVLRPRNKYSEAQKLQILEHFERYSARGIKKTFGVSKATLARWEKSKRKRR